MGDERKPGVKRVRLSGARFDGGRLPVDSLVELQKYQDVVRIAAEAEWRQAHPDEDIPADLRSSVSLTIERIDEGSADVFLAFEQHQVYVQYQAEAQDVADAFLIAAYAGTELPHFSALTADEDAELRQTVAEFGATLKPEQSIEFYPDGPDSHPVTITIETHKDAVIHLSRIHDFLVPPESMTRKAVLEKVDQSLVGRITAVDAAKKRFTLILSDGQELHGWYRQRPELLEDFREVVNSAAEGPLTRISGELQSKNGKPYRFWEASTIERIEFDDTSWGVRLASFAALQSGWDGGEATQVSSVALEAAQMILRAADRVQAERPGVFPTEEGGVLIEWADQFGVRSIETLADGSFEMFSLRSGQHKGDHSETSDLNVAVVFIETTKA